METEINVLTEQVNHLKSMIEWIVEAHGESITTKYTSDSSPWKLKDYVKECMLEFDKIGSNENEVPVKSEDQTPQVITNEHTDFSRLMYAIDKEITSNGGCDHSHDLFHIACNRLEDLKGYKIERVKTLEWMQAHGGYCDCEILMNAQFA